MVKLLKPQMINSFFERVVMKNLVNSLFFCLVLVITSNSIFAQGMPTPVWSWGTKQNTEDILIEEEEETETEVSDAFAAKSIA